MSGYTGSTIKDQRSSILMITNGLKNANLAPTTNVHTVFENNEFMRIGLIYAKLDKNCIVAVKFGNTYQKVSNNNGI